MKGKKSFTAYCDWIETFEALPDEMAGQLVKHLFRYVNDMDPEAPSPIIKAVFAAMKATLNRDLEKYKAKINERSRSGMMGNLKRYHPDLYERVLSDDITLEESQSIAKSRKTSHSDTKLADRDSDSVRDSVSEREREIRKATRAFDFLKSNVPLQLEKSFSIPFAKQITDKSRFVESFNDKVDFEGIPFEPKKLLARLRLFTRNWIDFQNKNGQKQPVSSTYKEFSDD